MKLLENIYLVGSGEIGISNKYDCHVYLIDGGDDAVLIDSGVGIDSNQIINNIKEHIPYEKLSRILLTHVHADHCGGAVDFQKNGIKVLVPDEEAQLLTNARGDIIEAFKLAQNAGAYPNDYNFKFFEPDNVILENEKIIVGKYEITPIHLRGHSPGLFCYYLKSESENILFTGDQVFINGAIGLLNCPGSDLNEYRQDIGKLKDLSVDALLPGHRLFVVKNGQQHINQAISNLSQVFVPAIF
ncbi:MAG: hydroxyacylglutathione hydrolase [Clostridiales bacterium]|nr:hydroxyacylglutathione hydrolase [Clostridiales bacterium]